MINEDDDYTTRPAKIDSVKDLSEIKYLLTKSSAITFNTNVLRIALNMLEERVSSVIVGQYACRIEHEMVLKAIKTS